MTEERALVIFTGAYEHVSDALVDLEAIEQLHKDDFVGMFDGAVVEQKGGKPRIVKRMDRPVVRVIPDELGFGPLSRKELKEAAAELGGYQAGLIVVGEPSLEKAFDEAVTKATKVGMRTVDASADEIAKEMQNAVREEAGSGLPPSYRPEP
ncbi:MAG TPA: hypothetical protein VMF65_14480 [Acidimicrobiales bacterium]|nr:hypothetical protein [Acidimicrobiales bacterium]